MNMIRSIKRVGCIALCLLFCLTALCAYAESAHGSLEGRFDDIPTFEYNGVTYRVRNRLTTVLIMGTARETAEIDAGKIRAEFIALLVIDDDAKTITPIQIDCLTPAYEGGTLTLRTLFSEDEDPTISCEMLLGAINSAMPNALMEHYLALDIDALEPYDAMIEVREGDSMEPNAVFKRRLKALKAQAEQSTTDELNDLFVSLSDHIVTDMKTGAIMKIIDKADRFEVLPTVHIPGSYVLVQEQEQFAADDAARLDILLNAFYGEMNW